MHRWLHRFSRRKSRRLSHRFSRRYSRRFSVGLATILTLAALASLAACHPKAPHQSDAELGLNPQQAAGRAIFDSYCLRCHEPYSTEAHEGPTLKAVFRKPYLPSGVPANDDRMTDLILRGRSKMPGFGQALSDAQVTDLIAYLHTL